MFVVPFLKGFGYLDQHEYRLASEQVPPTRFDAMPTKRISVVDSIEPESERQQIAQPFFWLGSVLV